MKRLIFFLILGGLLLLNNTAKAQVTYSYDDAGNRVFRNSIINMQSSRAKKAVVDSTVQKETMGKQEILIYPNPTKGMLKIEISGLNTDTPVHIVLMDANGRPLIERQIIQSPELVDITAYPMGWYLMRIIRGTEIKEWKIIKQ